MRRRLIAAAICFLILSIASMYAGYNFDRVLSQDTASCSVDPLVVLTGAWAGKARLLTLLLVVASAGGVLFLTLMPEYIKYKSNMIQVVPGVETPEAAGQGQYGTAHWLSKSEIPKVFAPAQIDTDSHLIAELLKHGYDDAQIYSESKRTS